jgi:GTP-binding protein Era
MSLKREAQIISAAQNRNLDQLQELLVSLAPVRPPEYDEEQVTDSYERDIAGDLIREACLLRLREEVPHGVGVRTMSLPSENGCSTRRNDFVERECKRIVIGRRKMPGRSARRHEKRSKKRRRPVFLELRAQLLKDWRNNDKH